MECPLGVVDTPAKLSAYVRDSMEELLLAAFQAWLAKGRPFSFRTALGLTLHLSDGDDSQDVDISECNVPRVCSSALTDDFRLALEASAQSRVLEWEEHLYQYAPRIFVKRLDVIIFPLKV